MKWKRYRTCHYVPVCQFTTAHVLARIRVKAALPATTESEEGDTVSPLVYIFIIMYFSPLPTHQKKNLLLMLMVKTLVRNPRPIRNRLIEKQNHYL